MNWYYSFNGAQQGPVSEQELVNLAANGAVNATTLVWREGLPDWQTLSVALPAALVTTQSPQIGGIPVSAQSKDLYVQQMREGVQPGLPGTMEYAGFWIRFGARIIDGFVVGIALVIVMAVIGGLLYVTGFSFEPSSDPEAAPPAAFIILGVLYYAFALGFPILYDWYMVSKQGATWGKKALGLKVVNEDGSAPSNGKAVGRAFAYLLNSFTCLIGFIIAGFDEQKRSLHDHICSTRVIRTR